MLTEFIKTNFTEAIGLQLVFDTDENVIEAYRSDSLRPIVIEKWMSKYSLFRGINKDERVALSTVFVERSKSSKFRSLNLQDRNNIREAFRMLLSDFSRVKSRNWISATSKLLWIVQPYSMVIYDSYVYRSLPVLGKIHPEIGSKSQIGKAPKANPQNTHIELSIDFFMRYYDLFHELWFVYQAQIERLKEVHGINYTHSIRIFDKLLWLLGSPNH